jgi:hypothetical protein
MLLLVCHLADVIPSVMLLVLVYGVVSVGLSHCWCCSRSIALSVLLFPCIVGAARNPSCC